MNLSLFDISTEFYALNDLMQDEFDQETGELINKDKEIEELYNSIKLSLEDKLDNSQRYVLTLQGEQDILANEIKRLQAKKTALKNKEDRLKQMMLSALKVSGTGKIKTSLYSFSTKFTKSVNIIDEDILERKYLRIKYEADKKKIGEDIKNGGTVKGAEIIEKESLGVR